MATKTGAFQDLQRLSMQLRNIIEIAPELQAIDSLENATKEAQAKLDHVRALMVEERNRHAETLAAEREKIIAAAHRDAARIRSEAGVDEARAEAVRIRSEAKAEVDGVRAEAARIKSAADSEISTLRNSIATMQTQLAEINSRIAGLKTIEADWGAKAVAAKAEHDRIVAAHEEFRSKVGLH